MVMVPGPFGGAERVFVAGVNGLAAAADCDVTALVVSEARVPEHARIVMEQLSPDVSVQSLVSAARIDFSLLRKLRQSFQAGGFDVIHSHGYKSGIYAGLAGAGRGAQAWVMTHHGVTAHTRIVQLYEWLERLAMRRADKVVAVSDAMQQALQRKGIALDKLRIVENMLALAVPERGAAASPPSILFLGRLSHEKGLDQLIAATTHIEQLADPAHVTFDIVGDGPLRQESEAVAPGSFQFHGFSDQPDSFLSRACAMVVPSRMEGMPMAVIEALAAGVPVIGFDVGGMGELVTEGVNGVLLPAGRTDLLAQALADHLDDPSTLTVGAQQQAEAIRNRFSVAAWVAATHGVYQDAIAVKDGAHGG